MAYDVVCIGNAIMDLIANVDEEFVSSNGFARGGMTLVDGAEARRRRSMVEIAATAPGGSVANTAACLASLGSRVAFVGKVGRDSLGSLFADGMHELGVHFFCDNAHEDIDTASCLAVVTPDGERTMSTYLGACVHLAPEDIPADAIANAKVVFIEGYLLDSPSSSAAVEHAVRIAEGSGTRVAITLSDAACVARHRERFAELSQRCYILIANEKEIAEFRGTSGGAEAAIRTIPESLISVVTRGKDGATVEQHGSVDHARAVPVERIVDLVGAGDAFAAGFLHAHVSGDTHRDALTVGAKCAAIIIQGQGARPSVRLRDAVYPHLDDKRVFA